MTSPAVGTAGEGVEVVVETSPGEHALGFRKSLGETSRHVHIVAPRPLGSFTHERAPRRHISYHLLSRLERSEAPHPSLRDRRRPLTQQAAAGRARQAELRVAATRCGAQCAVR
jgi:hypothetical protein